LSSDSDHVSKVASFTDPLAEARADVTEAYPDPPDFDAEVYAEEACLASSARFVAADLETF
jgi:hypothetical protein